MALKWCKVVNYNRQGNVKRGQQSEFSIGRHAQYLTQQLDPQGPSVGEHALHTIRQRPQEAPRGDLVAWGTRNMPAWCADDPMAYWQAADTYAARVNTHLAKEVRLALPREFSREQNHALVHAFVQQLPADHPTLWAYHAPYARNGIDLQPHGHVLISPKVNTGQHQDAASFFQSERRGGAPSQKVWAMPQEVAALQAQWEGLLRTHLRTYGLEHTLARNHTDKEVQLSWQEMKHLKHGLGKDFGHEWRLDPDTIRGWAREAVINGNEAIWLAQRGTRQVAHELSKAMHQERGLAAQREDTAWWQIPTMVRAHREHTAQAERVQALQEHLNDFEDLRKELGSHAAAQQQAHAWERQRYSHDQWRHRVQEAIAHTRGRAYDLGDDALVQQPGRGIHW